MSSQVDRLGGAKGSLAWKAPCRVATTANITLQGTQAIDGINVVTYDRVLVKDQTNAIENGIYCVLQSNWVRTKDFDGNQDVVKGTRVYVTDGTIGIGEYLLSSENPIVFETSDINFTEDSPVTGPVSSVDDNLALWDGTAGTLLKDAGVNITTVLTTANINSTGANGVQEYTAESTDVVIASDIGSTTATNAVQRYVGSTGDVVLASNIASTAANAVQPGYAVGVFDLGTLTTAADVDFSSTDGVFSKLQNDVTASSTLTLQLPGELGRFYLEVTNGSSPGEIGYSTDYTNRISGVHSTGASEISMAVITRHDTIVHLEWLTT